MTDRDEITIIEKYVKLFEQRHGHKPPAGGISADEAQAVMALWEHQDAEKEAFGISAELEAATV